MMEYGGYWIDFRRTTNPSRGVTRRWAETEQEFLDDWRQFKDPPWEVVAFGYRTPPPPLLDYGPFLLPV